MSTFAAYASNKTPLPKIYTLPDIETVFTSCDYSEVISSISDGFVAFSSGKFNLPPIQTMGAHPLSNFSDNSSAQTCVKSGYITGDDYYVVKVAGGGFLGNGESDMSPNTGLMQIYSQTTGRLEALLLDEGLLTEIRTAAAGALASSLLAPLDHLTCIGIIGTSIQARWQLRLLSSITPCRTVRVYGRNTTRIQEFVSEMTAEGWDVTVSATIEALVRESELVHTVTSAREALVKSEWVTKPMHFTCVGADAPGKQEMDVELIARADLLVTDARVQTGERGEFQHALSAGRIKMESIVEMGELVGNEALHRNNNNNKKEDDDRLTIFDTSGVAVQDVQITRMVYEALIKANTPSRLSS